MPKVKIIISIFIFSILLSVTSVVKTQTRIVEKKIYKIDSKIAIKEKDLHETQLDYFYLSSPNYLSEKIIEIGLVEYTPMDFSRIHLSHLDFINAKKKLTILKKNNEKKIQKK